MKLVTFVSAIIAVLLGYYLYRKSPDIAYQLSSPITVEAPSGGGSPKIVQQIEIANAGNAVAKKIQIRILKAAGIITVTKDSESDKYDEFKIPQGGKELVYESLRIGGRIKISLSGGDPLTEQDLEIRHEDGAARSGLTPENRLSRWGADFLFAALMLFYSSLSAREMAKKSFGARCRFHPIETLKAKKPFWLSHKMWAEGLEEAVTHASERHSGETDDVSSWHIHRLLNVGKPENLPEDVWAKVLPDLIDGFISRLTIAAQRSYNFKRPEEIYKLVALAKPNTVFDKNWSDFKEDLEILYSTAVVVRALWSSDFIYALKALQTAELDQDEKETIRRWLQALAYANLLTEVTRSFDPTEAIDHADLSPLRKADADALREFANGRRYATLMKQLRRLVQGISLSSEAPPEILADDWTNLKGIEQQIVAARDDYEKKRAELHRQGVEMAKEEAEVQALKAKLLRQIDVINTFINDPGVIDRIEEYEDVFAPGNLMNLRRLAERLRASNASSSTLVDTQKAGS